MKQKQSFRLPSHPPDKAICGQSKDGRIEDNWNWPRQGEGQRSAGAGRVSTASGSRRCCVSNDAHHQPGGAGALPESARDAVVTWRLVRGPARGLSSSLL